jgi:hypothetical protein
MSFGEDWRLRKYDAGMGETEYRIFRNGIFFAQFGNKKDADTVMVAMTCSQQSERDKVLDLIENFRKANSKEYTIYSLWVMEAQYLQELRQEGKQEEKGELRSSKGGDQ